MACSDQDEGHHTFQGVPIPIVIDDRERQSGVPEALQQAGAFRLSVKRLTLGDYQVDNRFLFERKTLSDFVKSILSGRLFDQALRLTKQDRFHPALVLEGAARDLRGGNMRREAMQGALVNLSLLCGLPVLRTRSPAETANTFLYAALQGRAVVQDALSRRGYRPKGKTALQSYILQGLPGIGPARAKELLRCFGSVRAVMAADAELLKEVDGVGMKTAARIIWALE